MSWWESADDEDEEYDEYDEADVKVRPNRRGSRPRTKTRPEHADAVSGIVLGTLTPNSATHAPAPRQVRKLPRS
jgi:hypothetical protein